MIGKGYRQPEDREYTILAYRKAKADGANTLAKRILIANLEIPFLEFEGLTIAEFRKEINV